MKIVLALLAHESENGTMQNRYFPLSIYRHVIQNQIVHYTGYMSRAHQGLCIWHEYTVKNELFRKRENAKCR